ncbi:hypothetical protein DID75_04400 [Candidatus Marinamargulisbacteria bacterium SCGC AG-410-N11]|nr:hypothetical protein DID75_04400 [Candidatus Marinamargulisbacteria bacterium SCGC AG-410-N11]
MKKKLISQKLKNIITFTKITLNRTKRVSQDHPLHPKQSLQQTISQVLIELKKPSMNPITRCQFAEYLEKLGIVITGNLNPQNKPFNPHKCFSITNLLSLKKGRITAAKDAMIRNQSVQFGHFLKRNKIVARLVFLITLQPNPDHPQKQWISQSISIAGDNIKTVSASRLSDQFHGHSEDAFLDYLSTHYSTITQKLKRTLQKNYPHQKAKVSGIIVQLSSTYKACDHCHTKLKNQLLSANTDIQTKIKRSLVAANINVPKNNKPIKWTVMYRYDVAPLSSKSHNSYELPTIDTTLRTMKNPSYSLFSAGVFMQHIHNPLLEFTPIKNMTLFLSGKADEDTTDYKQALIRTLLPRSIDKTSLQTATSEWFHIRTDDKLEEKIPCSICETPIIYPFIIKNQYKLKHDHQDNELIIGSKCVKRFDSKEMEDLTPEEREEYIKHRESPTYLKQLSFLRLMMASHPNLASIVNHYEMHHKLKLSDIKVLATVHNPSSHGAIKKFKNTISTTELESITTSQYHLIKGWLTPHQNRYIKQHLFFTKPNPKLSDPQIKILNQIKNYWKKHGQLRYQDIIWLDQHNPNPTLQPTFDISNLEQLMLTQANTKRVSKWINKTDTKNINQKKNDLISQREQLLSNLDLSNKNTRYKTQFTKQFKKRKPFSLKQFNQIIQGCNYIKDKYHWKKVASYLSVTVKPEHKSNLNSKQIHTIFKYVSIENQKEIKKWVELVTVPFKHNDQFKKAMKQNCAYIEKDSWLIKKSDRGYYNQFYRSLTNQKTPNKRSRQTKQTPMTRPTKRQKR